MLKIKSVLAVLIVMGTAFGTLAQGDRPSGLPDPLSDDPVERGEYLFRFQFFCVGCHIGPGADGSVAESLALAAPSGGELFELPIANVYARNLTVLGDWTVDEIETAVRYGISRDDEPLLPVMGFSLYEDITDADMADLIAYLQSLDPIENEVPEIEFLVPGLDREAFRFQGEIDIDAARPTPDFDDPLTRGVYLANTASCMHCHGQLGEDMIPMPAPDGLPWGWVAPSLLPYHLDPIYSTPDELRTALTTGLRPDETVLDAFMPWVIMTAWPDSDVDAIVAWMNSLPDVPAEDNPDPMSAPLIEHTEQ